MRHILTIDLEEWFHVCGTESIWPPESWDQLPSRLPEVLGELLDLLDRADARATFFVVGYVADRYPELVREIVRRGHRIGCHGYLHRRIYEMTPDEFSRDLDRSVAAIERACGVTPRSYRTPEWSLRPFNLWALRILASRGFEYDSSVVPMTLMGSRKFPRHTVTVNTAAGPITEVPLSTIKCGWERVPYTGGLAFRFVTEWYVHRHIRQLEERGLPAVVYVHPFDLVPELPSASLPPTRRLMQRFARQWGPARIRRLLTSFRYGSLEEVCAGAPADDEGPPPAREPGLDDHLRRSAWRTGFGITGLTVGAGLVGAALGWYGLLLPPAVLAYAYGNHLKHIHTWRRRADDVAPAMGPMADAVRVPDGLPGESPESTTGA